MRVAAVADLHCGVNGSAEMSRILEGVQDAADVLAIGGDLTNLGLPEEADALLEALAAIPLPVVAVLGNHDHESGQAEQLAEMLRAGGVKLLDGTTWELDGVGFAGVKGFGVGFAPHRLSAFGEQAIKTFVEVAVGETVALDHALAEPRDATSRRPPALLARHGDLGGRAGRDPPLPRRFPARGGAGPARGRRRDPRSRARRLARRMDGRRRPRPQRLPPGPRAQTGRRLLRHVRRPRRRLSDRGRAPRHRREKNARTVSSNVLATTTIRTSTAQNTQL